MIRRFFLACGLFLLAGSPLVAQQWATRMFETTEHDFGTVARGAKVEYRFVLSNIFLEDVHVLDARSSCGCTSLRIENPSLKTYAQGAIVAIFNTTAFQGQHGATVTVVIDKPFYAEVQLHVSGFIRSDVQIEPGSVQMGQFEQGSPPSKKSPLAIPAAATGKFSMSEAPTSDFPPSCGKPAATTARRSMN